MCSVSIPATLKRRRTAFSPNVANYASPRTALFIATFGSCDVMPCYRIVTIFFLTTSRLLAVPGLLALNQLGVETDVARVI